MNAGDTFTAVWGRYLEFLRENEILAQPGTAAFLTCGDWDLKTMLPQQLRISNIDVDAVSPVTDSDTGSSRPYAPLAIATLPTPFDRWINVKRSFQQQHGLRRARGMEGMLRHAGLALEGRHHSGIDDCKNILRIVQRMRADGWEPAQDLPRF